MLFAGPIPEAVFNAAELTMKISAAVVAFAFVGAFILLLFAGMLQR